MGKLITTAITSLDGYVADKDGNRSGSLGVPYEHDEDAW